MSRPQAESLFRIAETTLGDVTRVLESNDINYEHLTRGAWGVGVGMAFGENVLTVATVEVTGPEPLPVPYFYLSSGVLRNVSGDRQGILESCNSFNERWVTPAAYVLTDSEDESTIVLLKAMWPVVLFQHTPSYLATILGRFIQRGPELRALLSDSGIRGDAYRASEDDLVDLYFQSMDAPTLR